MGGAHSEREDFAKSAWRDVIDLFSYENALEFGSSINLTYRGNRSQNLFGRKLERLGGGGGTLLAWPDTTAHGWPWDSPLEPPDMDNFSLSWWSVLGI